MPAGLTLKSDITRFVNAYKQYLAHGPADPDPAIQQERQIILELLGSAETAEFVPESAIPKPVCRFIDSAHETSDENSDFSELVAASWPLAKQAVWRNKYRSVPGREALFQNFAFCDFVGSDGWVKTPDVTVGLTLLGPGTDYPFHEHPARELYLVLSGASDWAVDYEPFKTLPAGSWLLHHEQQPHAIRSLDEPMLAISAWRGDLHTRSRFTKRKPEQPREIHQ